jgi:hypothetical protein
MTILPDQKTVSQQTPWLDTNLKHLEVNRA